LPQTRSAKKRLRQNAAHRARNRPVRTHLRTRVKKFDDALVSGDVEEARKQALLLQKSFDRAVTQGIIHRNQARRKKSTVARKLNKLVNPAGGV